MILLLFIFELATHRSKAMILVYFYYMLFGVGVSCRILYFIVIYLYVSCNGSITSVGEERAHYENMPMQYTAIFHGCKNDNFRLSIFYYFHIFAQNIDCKYPQSMFWSKNKKIMNTPVNPTFTI